MLDFQMFRSVIFKRDPGSQWEPGLEIDHSAILDMEGKQPENIYDMEVNNSLLLRTTAFSDVKAAARFKNTNELRRKHNK